MFLHFEARHIHSKFCQLHLIPSRCRHTKVICKKGVLRNFAKLQENTCNRASFLIKLQGWGLATLLKKRLWRKCISVNFVKFLRTPFLTEHLRWLLLSIFTRDFNDTNLKKILILLNNRSAEIRVWLIAMLLFTGLGVRFCLKNGASRWMDKGYAGSP